MIVKFFFIALESSWKISICRNMARAAVLLALNHGIEIDFLVDECARPDSCGLSMLQHRSRHLHPTLDWEIADGKPDSMLCSGVLYDESEEECCGGEIYTVMTEGCCGNHTVYNFSQQGCCNNDYVYTYGTDGEEQCVHVRPTGLSAEFDCAADWPPTSYNNYWRWYCAARRHMVWAMTKSCKVGWLSVQQSSLEQAEAIAMEACNRRAAKFDNETCKVFDRDGTECFRQRCGDKTYNASASSCCGNQVIDDVTEACCQGTAFHVQAQGCCHGQVYSKALYGCCDSVLYDIQTHGCCPESGTVYKLGVQSCPI